MTVYPNLTPDQSKASAQLSEAAELWAIGRNRDAPHEVKVIAMHAISRDPVALGNALGAPLVDVEDGHDRMRPVVDLLRAAGADEAIAAAKAAWVRDWRRRRGPAPLFESRPGGHRPDGQQPLT